MKHVHTFGCPMFALQNTLASGNQLPRWSPRTCLGLNMGPSPMHAQNVYLVLNLITGWVSPQYHCCFDNFFETQDNTSWHTWCFWHHLLGTIGKFGMRNHGSFQGVSAKTAQPYILKDTIWGRNSYYKQIHLCTTYVWHHIGWLQRLIRQIICLGGQSPTSAGPAFSPKLGSHQLSPLSQLVQANVDKFAPCCEE